MRLLIPHEHGAYGQLGFPLAAALLAGSPGAAAGLLALACVAAFVAYEPALVLLGQRGARAWREMKTDAVRTLAATIAVAALAGIAGAWLMRPADRWTVLIPGVGALCSMALVGGRVHKTAGGELLVAVTLSACAVPVGVAAGLTPVVAAACAGIFAAGFCAATLAVRATIALQRREPASGSRAAAIAAALICPALFAWWNGTTLHPLLWTGAIPLSLLAIVVAVAPPSARHLRRIGWGLVAASAAETLVLVALVRALGSR
jgi:hypothetical protein